MTIVKKKLHFSRRLRGIISHGRHSDWTIMQTQRIRNGTRHDEGKVVYTVVVFFFFFKHLRVYLSIEWRQLIMRRYTSRETK